MKKLSTLIILLALSVAFVTGQDTIPEQQVPPKKQKPKGSNRDKIFFGGSFGLSFGSYTRIAIYPLVGYRVTPWLHGGFELGYEYIQDKRYSQTYDASNYGASIFARLYPLRQLFLHTEYALYNYELYYVDETSSRVWVPFLYLGAGYSVNLGPRTRAYAAVKFDVLQNPNSPYSDWAPFWSFGITSGF
jgi:hypothetical protein